MTLSEVFELWRTLPEAKSWPSPTWARQCIEHPSVYDIGDDELPFAFVDAQERRVLETDNAVVELASGETKRFVRLHWRDIPGSAVNVTVGPFEAARLHDALKRG